MSKSSWLHIVNWQSNSHTWVLFKIHSPSLHVLDLTTLHVYPIGQFAWDDEGHPSIGSLTDGGSSFMKRNMSASILAFSASDVLVCFLRDLRRAGSEPCSSSASMMNGVIA